MSNDEFPINSAHSMINVIREVGMIPFFKSPVRGWSIEELTHPDWWFYSSDELGPWDWKVDAVREGIVYGKYISRRASFATETLYRHLMNWRRSQAKYQVAEGMACKAATIDERLQEYLSPVLLSAIREHGTLDTSEIRSILEERVSPETRKKVGGHMAKYLIPKVTKQAVDFLMGFLDMGTWTVVGDITRVYRGRGCEYKGWQRNSITTPDALFKLSANLSEGPFWAKFVEDNTDTLPDCSPEESRQILIEHLTSLFPGGRGKFEKLI